MCGIAGIYRSDNKVNGEVLQAFSTLMKHRGPDDEGFCVFSDDGVRIDFKGEDTHEALGGLAPVKSCEEGELVLCHRRLSIIDLSVKGHQPMSLPNKLTISYNGELYNYKRLREELESRDYTFYSDTDTEVILNAYHCWGKECVHRFVGMWAFAIYNPEKKELFISRDRFGIKPLYFVQKEGVFAFASEIKVLVKSGVASSRVSTKELVEYVSFGTTAKPHQSMFEEIKDLKPGCNLILNTDSGEVSINRYYKLKDAVRKCESNFEHSLKRAVKIHMQADVEVGGCLSGGLDSSTIAYYASVQSKYNFKTFTAAFEDEKIDESKYAKLVGASLKNVDQYFTHPTVDDFLSDLDELIYYQDLPIGSTSIFAQWEVMKLAKSTNTKVLLDGQGADEILGGYYNFAGIYLIELMKKQKWRTFFREYRLLKRNFTPAINNAVARAFYYFLPKGIQKRIRKKNRIGMRAISKDFADELVDLTIPERGGRTFKAHSLLSVEYGLYDLLRYEDRNSMAFSIESRVPFLDHRVVESAIALPSNRKIKDGFTKYELRKLIDQKLPDSIVWRKDKLGFVTPQQEWKEKMVPKIREYILNAPKVGVLDRNYLDQLTTTNISSSHHLSEFWRMYSVLKWMEVYDVDI